MLTIGTRGSDLALWQAHHVRKLVQQVAGLEVGIRVVATTGDRDRKRPLEELGSVGVFTREIEDALLAGEIDIAVHSHKDLPTVSPPGLVVAAVPARGPVRDSLLVHPRAHEPAAAALPLVIGARIGTGSARRRAQLHERRPDLRLADLRGNVPTRVARLRDTEEAAAAEPLDAIVLAEAGLARLAIDPGPLRLCVLEPELMVPAPAQGALAIQVRADALGPDGRTPLATALAPLNDAATVRAVTAERQVLAALEGGCQLPLGAHARIDGDDVHLIAVLGRADGSVRRAGARGPEPLAVADRVLEQLNS
jgi:hydroxymethylbilane synthase